MFKHYDEQFNEEELNEQEQTIMSALKNKYRVDEVCWELSNRAYDLNRLCDDAQLFYDKYLNKAAPKLAAAYCRDKDNFEQVEGEFVDQFENEYGKDFNDKSLVSYLTKDMNKKIFNI